MIKNNIIVIMDETGSLLTEPIGMLRANANYSSTISLITPFDIEDTASITYSKSNRLNDDITQYLVPNGKLKGKDLLDETNPLYQTVHDWNVFEIGVNKKALAYIAKYRSGILYGAIGIGEIMQPYNAKNYKGTFGDTLLPETADEFDYYICNKYNHFDKDILWTINDYAYFYKGKWNKSNYKGLAVSSTFEMPVDPNLPADFEITQDDDLAVLLAGRVAVLEQEMITTNERIDELQDDMSLSVKIDEETINRNDLKELQVSNKVINDINSRTKNTDFVAYQQLVGDFLNGKLDKKPDGIIDLITPLNKIDARYLEIDNELFIVVLSLPATGVVNKIYLLSKGTPEGQNAYDEYIWVNSAWEKLGTITLDLSNIYNKTEVNGLLATKVDKNNAITAGTKAKITYDAKGLVTGGSDLVAGDIPQLSPSKITQDTNNRFVTDTEKSTWNGKQEALPTITQAQINDGTSTTSVVITPKLLRDNFYTESEIDNMIGNIETVLDTILGV